MSEVPASLAEAFKNVGVSRAYGPAVRVAGEELLPVALVSFGFGGGGSSSEAGPGSGTASPGSGNNGAAGGGGGGVVLPLGAYGRGRNGRVVFRPNTLAVLAGLTPLVCALGLAVRGVLRAAHSSQVTTGH